MKIFVLTSQIYDDQNIHGAFSSKEKAESESKDHNLNPDTIAIFEFNLDTFEEM
jgi:hypothetical protein